LQELNQAEEMHGLMKRLFPLCRSITGKGLRDSFFILKEIIPSLTLTEVKTGTKCFDWTIPREWNIRSARLTAPDESVVADYSANNLSIVNYSVPVDKYLTLAELQSHLYSSPSVPEAIPYVTSYYKEHWGFCLPHEKRVSLEEGLYHAKIDSSLTEGSLTYASMLIPGETEKEVLLSSYLCHPSMANNELSGPCVLIYLVRWLLSSKRRFSYRVVIAPETIGTIAYLSRHYEDMRKNTVAGFVLTCIGDDGAWSYIPSRLGNTYADLVCKNLLRTSHSGYKCYTFLDRGSDERQYCSPGIDLPVCSVTRSKYGTYREYHTSLDNLDFVSPAALGESFDFYKELIENIENNDIYERKILCEPQMSSRGLRSSLGFYEGGLPSKNIMNTLAYTDGHADCLKVSESTGLKMKEVCDIYKLLEHHELVKKSR
jgi:aminopeptidase-like protein